MITRIAKSLLLAGVALFYTLVVFNNLTDFDSNYQFVRHVLMMDSTFPGNHGMWRALLSPAWHFAFYLSIIAWEIVTTVLLWWGLVRLLRALRLTAPEFNTAKRVSVTALTLSLLMWLIVFHAVGGEWFLIAIVGLVFLILLQPDTDLQP
jgi:predicted small integral membrane protein